jgi:hypothetical protein
VVLVVEKSSWDSYNLHRLADVCSWVSGGVALPLHL